MSKQLNNLGELVFKQIDNLGFQLDNMGVENKINRHNLIAVIFAGKTRFEGEVDSVKARADSAKANVEGTLDVVEKLAKSGLNIVAFPATYALQRIKQAV